MIKARLTIKSSIRTFVRKLEFPSKEEISVYKGLVKTVEGSEVTNVMII